MSDSSDQHLGLSDLLDQDLSSYEYFYSLPKEIQNKIEKEDPGTFKEMQQIAERMR